MHLWNDYEGKTLARVFPLQRLLTTEGRSASFATKDKTGRPAVIRLTEALNDQKQMRERYQAIQAVHHPNLVEIESFGDTVFEGEPLIYAVTELTEESLADILRERRLSIEETGEVATSLVGAVEALHANGLVHGLVEPASVLAAGEVIKLRSDCVRFAPAGIDGARAYADDVFGVADVLHRALTQQRLHDASDALALPEPYASIVRNVVRGSWSIEQVASELRRNVRSAAPAPAAAYASSPTGSAPPAAAQVGSKPAAPPVFAEKDPSFAEALAAANRVVDRAAVAMQGSSSAGEPLSSRKAAGKSSAAPTAGRDEADVPLRYARSDQPEPPGDGDREPIHAARRSPILLVATAAVVLVALFLVLHFAHGGNKAFSPRALPPSPVSSSVPSSAPSAVQPAARPQASAPAPAPAPVASVPPVAATPAATPQAGIDAPISGGAIWRVVAYTYNRQDQAEAKARSIAAQHADLHPEVFSRSGRAPYLVTLGGPLSRLDAAAIRKRARSEGVARDVYTQNYSH